MLEKFPPAEYHTYRTYVCFLENIWDQLEYSAVGDTGSVSYGKPASLAAGSNGYGYICTRMTIPFFLDEDEHYFLSFLEVNSDARDHILLQEL